MKLSKQELKELADLGVPENLGLVRQMGVLTLLKFADKGTVKRVVQKTGNRNEAYYTAEFDDGVYRGVYRFMLSQTAMSPVKVLLECYALTGWPGFQARLNDINVRLYQTLK